MGKTIVEKIIAAHLVSGEMIPGNEISLRIDQTLTQDATGTMAYLEFETMKIPRVRTELSVAYVDHNTLQSGFENADDHRYLQSVAAKHGVYFSRPGNGICHQVHLERFGIPGKTLIGSDSHTPTAGGIGMLAFGAGGLDVAVAMGWRNVTCNNEVHSPADMKGLKLRVMENQMHIDHFNALGCSAIPMSFAEVYTSLQQGVIDAQENPYSQIDTQRFYEVQKYLIETNHIYDPTPVIASKVWWDTLDAEDQGIIMECMKEALAFEREQVGIVDGATRQRFIDENLITIVELTPEERAAFRVAAQPVYDAYADKIGADLIAKAEELQK